MIRVLLALALLILLVAGVLWLVDWYWRKKGGVTE